MAREREATNLHYQILEQEAIKVQVVAMKNMGRWSGGGRKGLPQLGDMGPQDDVPYLIDIEAQTPSEWLEFPGPAKTSDPAPAEVDFSEAQKTGRSEAEGADAAKSGPAQQRGDESESNEKDENEENGVGEEARSGGGGKRDEAGGVAEAVELSTSAELEAVREQNAAAQGSLMQQSEDMEEAKAKLDEMRTLEAEVRAQAAALEAEAERKKVSGTFRECSLNVPRRFLHVL
jgi:hypothetical protein